MDFLRVNQVSKSPSSVVLNTIKILERWSTGLAAATILQGYQSSISPMFICKWWAHQDSNLGPTGYEPVALPAELWALKTAFIIDFFYR